MHSPPGKTVSGLVPRRCLQFLFQKIPERAYARAQVFAVGVYQVNGLFGRDIVGLQQGHQPACLEVRAYMELRKLDDPAAVQGDVSL